jgi:hypothetical protein
MGLLAMKNILRIIILLSIAIGCIAQTPVIDIEDNQGYDVNGAYYKDTKNQLNPFEGTYIYTNGNTTLKIVLQKKTMSTIASRRFYEDLIIGEYQYIENGIEKRNTLNKLNKNYLNKNEHSISSSLLIIGTERGCTDCSPTEKRLAGGMLDYVAAALANVQLRRITVNGKAAIKLNLYWEMRSKKEGEVLLQPFIAPGDYILIKEVPVLQD